MDAYAIVGASFGAPKFHPRNIDDFVTVDGNAFTPVLDFPLVSPADSAEVVVSNDLEVSWTATEDFDGDDLTYEWVLYSADTASVKATVTSDANGTEPKVTLPYETVDGLLADAGLAEGESATFLWNVRVSDGSDTLHVHGSYGNFGDDFSPLYRHITLERSALVANETEGGVPAEFTLKQNYPNPFNPTTQIAFDLPKASKVRLTVFDMLGRKVSTLVNERMSAGSQVVEFDASRLSSGMYIYRIDAGTFTSTKKMMLIK
ncbi:MAG: T9SS type A sorting domain-containing protein [Balneolaceae bacterium]|nr:T9SS type A sorting domain-containing protein [Balneolaceae bacterium]